MILCTNLIYYTRHEREVYTRRHPKCISVVYMISASRYILTVVDVVAHDRPGLVCAYCPVCGRSVDVTW